MLTGVVEINILARKRSQREGVCPGLRVFRFRTMAMQAICRSVVEISLLHFDVCTFTCDTSTIPVLSLLPVLPLGQCLDLGFSTPKR